MRSIHLPFPALLIIVINTLALGACTKKPVTTVPKPLNIVALDRSGSTQAFRADQLRFMGEAMSDATDHTNWLAFWFVDRTATCGFGPKRIISDDDADISKIYDAFKTPTNKNGTRTRPLMLWQQMADKYSDTIDSPKQAITIVYLTDGGNDWADEAGKIPPLLARLAENPLVRVAVVGVNPELKPVIEKQFTAFGNRTVVWGRDATPDQVAKWRKEGK